MNSLRDFHLLRSGFLILLLHSYFQKNKTLNHQSFATSAIEKRIELLNKNSQQVVVTTTDLLENEKPTGTKINITIQSRE